MNMNPISLEFPIQVSRSVALSDYSIADPAILVRLGGELGKLFGFANQRSWGVVISRLVWGRTHV